MTREEYGEMYQAGRDRTIRFLLSRGAAPALVPDIAQAAWLRGWERLSQLRDPRMVMPWINTIALNQYKRVIRTESLHQEIRESDYGETSLNLAAIDISRMLRACRPADRRLLEAQLKGVTAAEIGRKHGLTASTVRIRFMRARRSARTALETPGVDSPGRNSAAAHLSGAAYAFC
jgi:DNA-directed RNA polymerase specialized sigma24 family protein